MKFKNNISYFTLLILLIMFFNILFSSVCFSAEYADSNDKEKTDKKSIPKSKIEEVELNKNLLLPNMSPGFLPTDIERTRDYYNNLKKFSPDNTPNNEGNNVVVPEAELKLPERCKKNAPIVVVKDVTISKSKVFSDDELNKFKSLVENKSITAEDLNNLVYLINAQYRKKNFITAKAYIPASTLKGGALHIELLEAKIGKIIVENNKYNRTFFLKSSLTQKEGDVLNIETLQNDLRRFNSISTGVKLTARLKPGIAYGTTDVVLIAAESFPIHLIPALDNFGRSESGLERMGFTLATDNVFGVQDRLTSSISMSRGSFTPYLDYNLPVNRKGTRIGASYMHGNTNIIDGDYREFDINSKIDTYSMYITHPLIEKEKFSLSGIVSANYKNATSTISNFEYTNLHSKSISAGVNGRYYIKDGAVYISNTVTNGYVDNSITGTNDYFVKYNGSLFYIKYFKNGIILNGRAGVQVMPENIPFIEQFQLGGISTVRGYAESLFLGQSAYYASLEALFPIPFLPEEVTFPVNKETKNKFKVRDSIKFATFFDNGGVFRYDEHVTNNNYLSSVGCGLRIALSKYLTARLYWGFGLRTVQGEPSSRFHFDLVSTPF